MNFALISVIKSTLLLSVAGLLTVLFRRSSASLRHGIWAAGISGSLLAPFAMPLLPAVDIPITFSLPQYSPAGTELLEGPVVGSNPASLVWQSSPEQQARTSRVFVVAAVAWLAGVLFVLARFALGARAIRRLLRDAGDGGLRPQVNELQRLFGIRRDVRVAVSDRQISPMAWRTLHPVVLLPAAVSAWPESRLRTVLAHELGHVKRGDGIMQLVSQACCSIYWFNPVVWLAVHRMRIEREHACDDQALQLGLDPVDYASHLLEIARSLRQPKFAGAVSMSATSQLEARLVAILDPNASRHLLSRWSTTALSLATAAIVFSLGMARPAWPAPLASAVIASQSGAGVLPPQLITTIANPAYTVEAFEKSIKGTVTLEATIDKEGGISGAHVIKGLGYGLDENAIAEVSSWRFQPASPGPPLATRISLDVEFKLAKAGIPLEPGVVPPVIISRIEPGMTEEARAARAKGTVILQAIVRVDGTVDVVRPIQSLGYGLTESAIQALRLWTFQPATKDGARIPARINISIVFDWR